MFLENLLINTIGTILGGIFLSIIYFIFSEKLFPKKNLTGEWEAILKYTNTSYIPYKGIKVYYKIHILHRGNEIVGTGEKFKEESNNNVPYEFEFEKRVTLSLEGYFERKILTNSKIYINITEDGRKRETRSTFFLELKNEDHLLGKFISTAANTRGYAELKRVTF